MDYSAMSLAELRAEAKKVRNELYKPVSRSKKSDLVAELARHRGVSPASSKSEAAPEPEKAKPKKAPKPVAEKAKPKKAAEEKPKKKASKNEAESPKPKKKAPKPKKDD
jgi:hypothetical protein